MSADNNRHYRMSEVMSRHFVQTGKAAGLGSIAMRAAITDLLDRCTDAPEKALAAMPKDFAHEIHKSFAVAIS